MLSIKAASEKYPLSKSLLYELCKQGRLKHYRVGARGRGKILVDETDLEELLQSCRVDEEQGLDEGELKFIK